MDLDKGLIRGLVEIRQAHHSLISRPKQEHTSLPAQQTNRRGKKATGQTQALRAFYQSRKV